MSQKAVKNLSLTINGTSYKIIDGSPNVGRSVSDVDVTTFGDEEHIQLPHPQPTSSALKLTLADDGTAARPEVGVVGTYVITTTYTDGSAETSVATTITGYLGKADPATLAVGGERRPTWDCELRRVGDSTTTTSTTTTTAG